MNKHKRLWNGTKFAVAGLAAVSMCVPLVSSAIADNSSDTTDKLSITKYSESDYISNAVREYSDSIYGSFNNLSGDQVSKLVSRATKVEALTDEDANYNQKWRITWNLGNQSNDDGKGTKAVPYGKGYYDDTSNPKLSFMVSQDLDVISELPDGTDVTPVWYAADRSRYQAGEPYLASNALKGSKQKLWITKKGDLFDFKDPKDGARNTLTDLYYFGQYKDSNGKAASSDWQDKAKACLAGATTSGKEGVSISSDTCGDRVEWLNKDWKSFSAGYRNIADPSTQFNVGQNEAHSKTLFNEFAKQVGGVQVISTYTAKGAADTVFSIEFWTHRTPWAGNGDETTHRTFVGAHYKSNWGTYLYETTQFKYVEVEDIDSDGDGLTDRFELGIGSDPKNKDTDGDGVEDGVEVESKTPVLTDTGFKITGTDPTVAQQKPSNPAKPTGKRGEIITGQTKPYLTVELYDITGKKLLGSTVADSNGNYSLEVGKALNRNQINKYGNNIVFSDETNRVPELYDLPADNDIADGDTVAVHFWSDGMDTLPNSDVTRPQFSKPTGTIAIAPKTEPVEVKDPSSLTDTEKNQIKEEVKKNFPDAGDGDITINPDGSATVKVPVTNPTTGEKTTSVVTIPAEDTIAKKQVPSADKSSLAAAPSENPDQKPVTGDEMTLSGKVLEDDGSEAGALIADRNVTVVVPQADGTTKSIPAKTDDKGNIVDRTSGKPITFPAAAGEVKLYDGDDTSDSATPLKTTTIAVADPAKAVVKGKPSSAVVNKPVTGMTADITDADVEPVSDGTTVYVKNPVTGDITPVKVTNGSINIPEFTPTEAGSAKVEIFSDSAEKNSIGSATIPVVDKAIDDTNSSVSVDLAEDGDKDGNGELNPGDTAEVTGTIADENGNPIAGRDLTVVLPNGTKIPATTDEKGTIVAKDSDNGQPITFTPTEDGTVKVFEGTPENVDPATSTPVKTADVDVKDRSITSATVDNAPESGFTGTEISGVTATVKDAEDDNAPDGTKVYVKVPGADKPVAATVGKDGKVEIPAFTPTAEGDATIQIFADQEGTKEIGKATVPVTKQTIDAGNSDVTAKPSADGDTTIDTRDEVTVNVTLKDGDGNPIAGREVTVVLPDGKTVNGKTDENGKVVDENGDPIKFTAGEDDGTIKVFDGKDADTTSNPAIEQPVKVHNPAAKSAEVSYPDGTNATVANPVTGGTITVKDKDGNPVPDDTVVYVTVPGAEPVELKTKDGKVSVPEFTPTATGNVSVKVSTSKDSNVPALVEKTLTVAAQTPSKDDSEVAIKPVDDSDPELNPGDKVTVDGTIKDANGKPIAGHDITVVLPDGTEIPATTDSNGKIVAKVDGDDYKVGDPITFTAQDGDVKVYDGSDTDGEPILTQTVDTKDRSLKTAEFQDVPETAFTGSTVTGVTATVKDAEDDKVASGTVYVKVPGKDEPVAATITNGKVEIPAFTPTEAGDQKIVISSDPEGANVLGQSGPIKVTKQKINADESDVTAKPSADGDTTIDTGDEVTVNVTLKDGDGNPIAGRDVTVVLPNGTPVTGKTDKDGKVVDENGNPITYTAGEDDGTIKVYDGTDTTGDPAVEQEVKVHNPAPKSAEVTYPKDTNATVANPVKGGEVVVKDKDGNAVPDGTTVYVNVPGADAPVALETKDGKVSVPEFTPTEAGDATVTVSTDAEGKNVISTGTVSVAAQTPNTDNSTVSVSSADKNDTELNPGDKATVDGTIKDGKGTPVAGRDLTVVLPDGTVVPATTDENGNIVNRETGEPITYVADKDGEVKVYDGANVDPNTTTDEPILTQKVDVKDHTATDATIDGLPGTITAANPVDGVTVTVVDEDGDVVPDGTVVYVKVPGADAPVALETKGGKVTVPSFAVGEAGDAAFTVSTDEAGENVIAKQDVTVSEQKPSKDNSNVNVTPSNPNKGDVVTVDGEVKDENGQPIKGADVIVTTPGGKTISATTDANGKIVAKDANGNATDKPVRFKAGKSGDVVVSVNGVEIARATIKVKSVAKGSKDALATTGSSVIAVAGLALMALVAAAGVTAIRRRA